ncbi:hypothetical protein [Limosilactobacillus kribbianus]|uniref:hypothetical protein n=1 Tax=Limosilactobacillus kribbianus TaxID=2982695 RepID=UPI002263D2AD|nr:hypothetical protein [Limosilactobacillus kribbianus]
MIKDKFKAALDEVQEFRSQLKDLQAAVHGLQGAINEAKGFADAVSKDIAKWQFKARPRLDRIQEIVNRLNKATK